MNLVDELHAISAALRRAEVHYAVCGGVAVTIYGATRLAGRAQDLADIEKLTSPGEVP